VPRPEHLPRLAAPRFRPAYLLAPFLALLPALCEETPPPATGREEPKVSDEELARALAVFSLKPPASIKDVSTRIDNLSISFVIVGQEGVELSCCVDGPIGVRSQRTLWTGSDHPRHPGATSVARGAPAEKAVCVIVRHVLDQSYTRARQRQFFRKPNFVGLDEKEVQAKRLVEVLDALSQPPPQAAAEKKG